jgi:Sortase domain
VTGLQRHRPRKVVVALDVAVVGLVALGIAGFAFGWPGGPPPAKVRGSLREHPERLALPTRPPLLHESVAARLPIGLSIPALEIDTRVIRLGLNPNGTLEVPSDPSVAGWYRLGVKPGERGAAVIVGHVDSQEGPAVFYRLGQIAPGERIVVRSAGERLTFRVYAVREYPKTAFPTELVYGQTALPELRLVTCGGSFDESTGHYLDNVVVFARWPREESNLRTRIRSPLLYPLSYGARRPSLARAKT